MDMLIDQIGNSWRMGAKKKKKIVNKLEEDDEGRVNTWKYNVTNFSDKCVEAPTFPSPYSHHPPFLFASLFLSPSTVFFFFFINNLSPCSSNSPTPPLLAIESLASSKLSIELIIVFSISQSTLSFSVCFFFCFFFSFLV